MFNSEYKRPFAVVATPLASRDRMGGSRCRPVSAIAPARSSRFGLIPFSTKFSSCLWIADPSVADGCGGARSPSTYVNQPLRRQSSKVLIIEGLM